MVAKAHGAAAIALMTCFALSAACRTGADMAPDKASCVDTRPTIPPGPAPKERSERDPLGTAGCAVP